MRWIRGDAILRSACTRPAGVFTLVCAAILRCISAWAGPVVFSEVMYNPSGADGFRQRDKNTEWIELFNAGMNPVDLGGWRLYKISRTGRQTLLGTFQSGITIPPLAALVVVTDGIARPEDFRTAWSIEPGVGVYALSGWSGTSARGLPNSGATLRLTDNSGQIVDELAYRASGFPPSRNGLAIELVVEQVDPSALPALNDDPRFWRHAREPIAAPGTYSGVLFGSRDRGSPGTARITPTPEPYTGGLWACGLLLCRAVQVFTRRRFSGGSG